MRINTLWPLAAVMIALLGYSTVGAQTKCSPTQCEKPTLFSKACVQAPKCTVKPSKCAIGCDEKAPCGLGGCGVGGLGMCPYGMGGYGILDSLCLPDCRDFFPEAFAGFETGGWLQMGYHTEGTNGFGTGLFNNYPNVVQLQQAYLYAEKEANNYGCGWDWGFRFDYVYGTDGIDTQAFGSEPGDWDRTWNAGGFYGHAFPQLYAEVAYNDLKIKVGHFYTIMVYEVVTAPDNFFYSHAYTRALAEPFTHTGALAEWTPCDGLTFYGGWTEGWDTGYSDYHGATFLGGVTAQLFESLSVTYTTSMGNFGFGPGGSDSDAYAHSIVVDWGITDRVNYVFQTDYVDNQLWVGPGTTSKNVGINQYLLYRVNDCWAFGGRFEWFNLGGYDMGEITLGANISPHDNLMIRPEVRLDQFEPGATRDIGLRDSTVFGIDAIYTF